MARGCPYPLGVRSGCFSGRTSKLCISALGCRFAKYGGSITPWLQGGCILSSYIIKECRSAKTRSILIDEYAKRRRKLFFVTQSCLPPGVLRLPVLEFPSQKPLGTPEHPSVINNHRGLTRNWVECQPCAKDPALDQMKIWSKR